MYGCALHREANAGCNSSYRNYASSHGLETINGNNSRSVFMSLSIISFVQRFIIAEGLSAWLLILDVVCERMLVKHVGLLSSLSIVSAHMYCNKLIVDAHHKTQLTFLNILIA